MILSPSTIFAFSSVKIILSASPSKEIPKSVLNFFVNDLIFSGYVEPHLKLMFIPFGLVPTSKTFAPKDLSNFGALLYAAPLAQSIAIFRPLSEKLFGKLLFKIFT